VYFSATVGEENFIGLDEYLIQEGMGMRLVPYKSDIPVQFRIDKDKMFQNFLQTPKEHSKTPQTGYFYRGFDNPNIFFDQVHNNIVQNYRSQFLKLAYAYYDNQDTSKVKEVLDKMEVNMPRKVVHMDYRLQYDVAMLYFRTGSMDKFTELIPEVEASAMADMKKNPNDMKSYYNPYRILLDIYEAKGDTQKALDVLYQIDRLSPNNPDIKAKIESLKNNKGK
jgi:tetratricopeptide (TPR) repeat protein